jgi:hypothetical protein
MSLRVIRFLLLSLGFSAAAQATSTLTVALDPSLRYLNPLEFVDVNGNTTGYAGVIQTTLNSSQILDAFCLDLYHDVSPNTTYHYNVYAPNDPSSQAYSTNVGRAAWLYVNFLPVVNAATGNNKGIDGAALQLAIWDVIHDNGNGLTSGTIRMQTSPTPDNNSSAAYGLATTWITASAGHTSNGAAILINGGGPSVSQTLITNVSALSASNLNSPEPEMMGLVGAGLLTVGLVSKRISEKTSRV